jgi:hypothetical protein
LKKFWVKNEWFKKDPEVLEVWDFYKSIREAIEKSKKVRPDVNKELLDDTSKKLDVAKYLLDLSCSIIKTIINEDDLKELSVDQLAFMKVKMNIDISNIINS